jgi:hypothetical protein
LSGNVSEDLNDDNTSNGSYDLTNDTDAEYEDANVFKMLGEFD